MVATVLVGPGKPKLVQIPRPPSGQSRTVSSVEEIAPPATPKQALEVSAFSPYDTPYEVPPRIESSAFKMGNTSRAVHLNSYVPQPLAFPARSNSGRSDSNAFSSWQHICRLADVFEVSPRSTQSDRFSRAYQKRWAIREASELDMRSPPDLSPTTKSATWLRCRKLERTMNTITRAIDDFPDDMLLLDSHALQELRNQQVSDQTYIEAFQRIFPLAPSPMISALTAWIIVDLSFSRLYSQRVPLEQSWAPGPIPNESLNHIPEKAREMLGIGLPDATSIRQNEYALRKRATAIQACVSVIGHKLVEALRGSWDEDIWRSLRVLVEVIESSPQPWT